MTSTKPKLKIECPDSINLGFSESIQQLLGDVGLDKSILGLYYNKYWQAWHLIACIGFKCSAIGNGTEKFQFHLKVRNQHLVGTFRGLNLISEYVERKNKRFLTQNTNDPTISLLDRLDLAYFYFGSLCTIPSKTTNNLPFKPDLTGGTFDSVLDDLVARVLARAILGVRKTWPTFFTIMAGFFMEDRDVCKRGKVNPH